VKPVYFLARAYNDFDCRLPLLFEFAQDANYSVTIIAIPTNTGIQDPKSHELYESANKNGIAITTIYDFGDAGLLLLSMFRLYVRTAGCKAMEKLCPRLHNYLLSTVFRIVRWRSIRNNRFIPGIFEKFESAIVIADEIIFHQERSFFIDNLYTYWKKLNTFELYAFLTGQDTYIDLWEDNAWGDAPVHSRESIGVTLFVPGPNDARVMRAQLPSEDIVVTGNTRFDKSWVVQRAGLSPKGAKSISRQVGVKAGVVKIVFMLSKIEYGVEVVDLVETMNRCAVLDNSVVIMKPHTRGMKFDALGHPLNTRILDGSDYSSSDLIEWADFVFFTGSSIAFHALVLGKKVCYLRYCQRYKSIYDAGEAVIVADSIAEVLKCIHSPDACYHSEKEALRFLATHIYNGNENGQVCQDVKARIECLSNLTARFVHAGH
jgi:hypothetical protein